MREIEFRGKRKDNGEWVYGCLLYDVGSCESYGTNFYIADFLWTSEGCSDCGGLVMDKKHVDLETVGQYTGLTDRHEGLGKTPRRIWEGDRVECKPTPFSDKIKGTVKMIDGCWEVETDHPFTDIDGVVKSRIYLKCLTVNYSVWVIDNIHDNGEFLEEGK